MAETQVHETATVRDTGGASSAAATGSGANSLFKNAYFLMLSTGVSAVLGLGFWLVAARYYSEEAVGQGSAAIAAMRLLASITATTMIGAVIRFVPRAGGETARLVWGVYGASSLIVALAAGVFLLTLDQWGASYAPLGTPAAGAVFVAACVAWALLTLQDGVLTGLRKAEWVPAGNAVFSIGKLVLLAVFASALPALGIFVSWAVAIAFSTLPLGWLIFRRLIPRQAAADRHLEPPRIRDMGRFLAGDSLGALFSLAMINLLPVMVAVRFSAAENGYFYVAYTVGGTMEFMAINMASSLTAHASHDPRQLADGVRGALRRMTLLLVPVVLVLVVFAPQILTPFSPDYAEHGATVLRLLALGALPRVVVELYIGVLRVQGRTGALAVLQGAMCVLVLGSAAVLLTPAGIAGAGWAVLISMTLIAIVSVLGLRSALRERPDERPALPPAPADDDTYGTRWARLNATAGYGTGWARRAAYEGGDGEDTVTLFIGRPGYEREALQADTLALIVRPHAPRGRGEAGDEGEPPGDEAAAARDSAPRPEAAPEARQDRPDSDERVEGQQLPDASDQPDARESPVAQEAGRAPQGEEAADQGEEPVEVEGEQEPDAREKEPPARSVEPTVQVRAAEPSWERRGPAEASSAPWAYELPLRPLPGASTPPVTASPPPASPASPADDPDRRLKAVLWALLGLATAAFWLSLRALPRLGGSGEEPVTGRRLLTELPLPALGAGGVLLLVFVASVTLCTHPASRLAGTALGSALLALYAAPVALGWEPSPVGGTLYAQTAGSLAEALGLDGPGPLLRWVPLVCLVLCLVPLGQLLARAGPWLSEPGRWGVLYLVAVGGWVWRDQAAPYAPLLLVALIALVLLLPLGRAAVTAAGTLTAAGTPLHHTQPHDRQPNETSKD